MIIFLYRPWFVFKINCSICKVQKHFGGIFKGQAAFEESAVLINDTVSKLQLKINFIILTRGGQPGITNERISGIIERIGNQRKFNGILTSTYFEMFIHQL